MTHRVIQAYPTPSYQVYVYFAEGVVKRYDVRHLVGKGVFAPLSDVQWYLDHCTVLNGTLAWDPTGEYDPRRAIDIDPEVIYDEGETVEDPLAGTA
jgi:hypothetical protein